MKTKVLVYAQTSDKVIVRYKELTEIGENVYSMLIEKNPHGNHKLDVLGVVFAVADIYFYVDELNRQSVEDNLEKLIVGCRNWRNTVKEKVAKQLFISLLEIKVFELLGEDVEPLLYAREQSLEMMRLEAEEAKRRKKAEREQLAQVRLDECKRKFINGGQITGSDFAAIARRDGVAIHPRTKSTLINSVYWLDKEGFIKYKKGKGKRCPKLYGCRCAIDSYLDFLEMNQS